MPPRKTPTSSLSGWCTIHFSSFHLIATITTVIELFAKRVWYRSQARIQRTRSGGSLPSETSTTCVSYAARLALEIVEMIIAYLAYDTPSLRACTLTCYSWYIAAVPHLHYNLFIGNDIRGRKFRWPDPLRHMHRLGLLPLVKTFYFRGYNRHDVFSLKRFNCCILRQFSMLTNVRRLMIDYLDIPSFMPRIRRYFRHFLPTVRELCLKEPKGSRRQIIYFIGLFERLGDLSILYNGPNSGVEPVDDLTLTPTFTPPLGGQLRLAYFRRVGLLKDMIDLFGGIRFSFMDLFDVEGMPLLLGACAKTLKTLVLWPSDPRGKQLSPESTRILANDLSATISLLDFDLSRMKCLRTIQVMAWSIDRALSDGTLDASSLLNHALSTIRAPSFFEVEVLYRWDDFRGVESWQNPDQPPLHEVLPVQKAEEASRHRGQFEVLRRVRNVRDFRLVLIASVWHPVGEYSVQMLKEAIAEERAYRGFGEFFPEPLVAYYPRRSRL